MEEPLDYRARLVGDTLRHQAWVIALALLIGIGLGYGASVARPGSYVASATVLITPLAGNPYSPGVTGQDSLVSIETEAKVASSDNVSGEVSKALADQGIIVSSTTLGKGVSVSVPSNTQIIEIEYASDDASFAKVAAEQYVTQYLALRRNAAEAVNQAQIPSLVKQRDNVAAQLNQLKQGSATVNNSAQAQRLSAQVVSLQSQIDNLNKKPVAGKEISPATTPVKTSGLSRPLYLVGGAMLGLVAGLALALARQRRDDRIYHADEIDAAGIPVVAAYGDSEEESAEAVRLVRGRVLALSETTGVVVVGPADPGDARSAVAADLVQSLTKVGRSVVLVNLLPDRAEAPGETVRHGFTDLLNGDRKNIRNLLVDSGPNLQILPRGRAELGDAIEYLDPDRLSKMLGDLPQQIDYVVLDAPALTDSAGETLMRTADLIVVTATLGRSTRRELALLKTRGDERLTACLTPRPQRGHWYLPWRSREEGSKQVSRRGEALTVIDDSGEEKSA